MTITNLVLPVNTPVRIGQGFNGSFTHKLFPDLKVDDRYSLDFMGELGDRIYAVAPGTVSLLKIDGKDKDAYHGKDVQKGKDAAKHTNYIAIDHGDFFSLYMHLPEGNNGLNFEIGAPVTERFPIGYIGQTGWSTAPHLHFAICAKTDDGWRRTISHSFRDYDGPLEDTVINSHLY
ncbi:TPA: M23 family metallopeptidase [Candidatus Woesearchaeota archaeon]|nr:hypothetical protein [archaeon]HIJ12102.1 M23 family metallopeptidase [Candidatus Woesearchaeota archaeon]|tara:strand:+ start:877 stop:1404 length:528 start_codon:yes stop_codon:yes gene_type:complete